VPQVTLATAHPAKFPEAVEAACGIVPVLPDRYAGLMTGEERCLSLPGDLAAVQTAILETFGPA
jgi:threonine synthase